MENKLIKAVVSEKEFDIKNASIDDLIQWLSEAKSKGATHFSCCVDTDWDNTPSGITAEAFFSKENV